MSGPNPLTCRVIPRFVSCIKSSKHIAYGNSRCDTLPVLTRVIFYNLFPMTLGLGSRDSLPSSPFHIAFSVDSDSAKYDLYPTFASLYYYFLLY